MASLLAYREISRGAARAMSIEERLWSGAVANESGCWLWKRSKRSGGYGQIWHGRNSLPHRVAYELENGPIPEGMTVDHLCNEPSCINPSHLSLATQRQNILRSTGLGAMNATKTHCKRGHEFTEENTYVFRNLRACRACARVRRRDYFESRKAKG